MAQIRAYVSHSIRGKMGKDATPEYMRANNNKAIKLGQELRREFPTIDFYVPGDHDEFVLLAFMAKYLNEKQILDVDCMIVDKCNFVIAYTPDDFISGGMRTEIDYANLHDISVLVIDGVSDNGLKTIHRHLE